MADTDTPLRIPPTIPPDAEQRLATGTISVVGRMPNASNGTFLVQLDDPDASATSHTAVDESTAPYGLAIYKPGRGERPLWDFLPGLFRREVAAFRLSQATGLDVIPPTVLRSDGPLGEGSIQLFIEADF